MLIHQPKVLFLDEPTTGVDAVSRREFWAMLKKLQKQHITIFVSTPYMDEANMCDEIAFIQDGQILSVNTPEKMVINYTAHLWAIKTADRYQALHDLNQKFGEDHCYIFGEYLHLSLPQNGINEEVIHHYLVQLKHREVLVKRTSPTIEDCFLYLMKQKNIHGT